MKTYHINGLVLAIMFLIIITLSTFAYRFYSLYDIAQLDVYKLQQLTTEQHSDNQAMAATILILSDEVQLRQDLTSLIIDASRSYNIDPKLLAITIKSESNFRPNPQHALPYVKGSAGINVKANNKLKHNASSYVGNVYASAEILSRYIETSDSLTLALTRYKGLSPQGFGQAKEILKEYNKSNQ